MKFKRTLASIVSATLIFLSLPAFAADKAESSVEPGVEYMIFDQISEYVSEHYLDDSLSKEDIKLSGLSNYLKDNDEALIELLKATLTGLDPYSDFFTAEEYVEYINQINQTFYGIGVQLQKKGDYIEITGFAEENSTAEKSGFQVGDKIIKVNGEDVVGKSLDEVRNKVIGELNTTVLITVLRGNSQVEITGTRVAVSQSTVSGGIMKGDIGYISIKSFGANTASEFETVKKQFEENNIKNVILDLRGNPGGIVDAATDIAKMIVPRGEIVKVSYRDTDEIETYRSELANAPFKMIVLVNENTASSSEILASAIQDSGAGIIMGTQTYGKAVIQKLYNVGNGRMILKLTVGQYLTRNGQEINEIGIEPDEYVTNYTKNIDTTTYTQLDFQNRYAIGQNGSAIKGAKERLTMLGYYDKNEDTVFDEELQKAVKVFQKDMGLAASGVLDIATQVKLKEQFEKLETVVDRQLQTAYEKFGGKVEDLY